MTASCLTQLLERIRADHPLRGAVESLAGVEHRLIPRRFDGNESLILRDFAKQKLQISKNNGLFSKTQCQQIDKRIEQSDPDDFDFDIGEYLDYIFCLEAVVSIEWYEVNNDYIKGNFLEESDIEFYAFKRLQTIIQEAIGDPSCLRSINFDSFRHNFASAFGIEVHALDDPAVRSVLLQLVGRAVGVSLEGPSTRSVLGKWTAQAAGDAAPEPVALPTTAPALWVEKWQPSQKSNGVNAKGETREQFDARRAMERPKGDTPPAFVTRHYGPPGPENSQALDVLRADGTGLTRAYLGPDRDRLDPSLYTGINNWLSNKKNRWPDDCPLPTRSEAIDTSSSGRPPEEPSDEMKAWWRRQTAKRRAEKNK